MASQLAKGDWILLALQVVPLDRIRLMKTLFLVWHDAGRNIPDYFDFVPYLYGPCSFEVYSELDRLLEEGFIVQPPHPIQRWARYYLTESGRQRSAEAAQRADSRQLELIRKNAAFAAEAGFRELLLRVYKVAPEFAVNSLIRPERR